MHESIDIKCPNCKALAKFEEPFRFISSDQLHPEETHPWHKWGGWIVVERFPSQFKWIAPSTSPSYQRGGGDDGHGGYPLLTHGLVQCPFCHMNEKHTLHWPDDAYWQWHIRGEVLWAWDRVHAETILAYIKGKIRPSRKSHALKYIPSHFLSAKVRDLVVRKMEPDLF